MARKKTRPRAPRINPGEAWCVVIWPEWGAYSGLKVRITGAIAKSRNVPLVERTCEQMGRSLARTLLRRFIGHENQWITARYPASQLRRDLEEIEGKYRFEGPIVDVRTGRELPDKRARRRGKVPRGS